MAELPTAPIERIIRNCGAQRVSAEAAKALRDAMEDYAEEVATKAFKLAQHSGRKTVQAGDIKLSK
jgi:histone H3/H4